MADFRQIMWRKFLRSLCKYNTMEQPVLPHNVAWPFSAFLPSWCRHLSAAKICGRKRILTLNLASILRKMVLPDNVASGILPSLYPRTYVVCCHIKHILAADVKHILVSQQQYARGGRCALREVTWALDLGAMPNPNKGDEFNQLSLYP